VIRVLVADDHAILRKGIKALLGETGDLVVTGEAARGDEVLARLQEQEFDILVMDISMPGGNGIDTLRELRNRGVRIPVLIVSMYPEDQYGTAVIRAGASGYVAKSCALDEIIVAIRKVASGGQYISPALAEQLAPDYRNRGREVSR